MHLEAGPLWALAEDNGGGDVPGRVSASWLPPTVRLMGGRVDGPGPWQVAVGPVEQAPGLKLSSV